MKSKIADYIVLDVETGGIITGNKLAVLDVALTEVALVYVRNGEEIIGTYSNLIKPYIKTAEYNPKAAEVSGISKEDCLKQGIEIKQVVKDFIDFIGVHCKTKTKPILVGHNLREFDSYFIENMFAFAGKNLYDYVQTILIDTLEEAWKIFPERDDDFKLGTICRAFDVELMDAHRALPDTVANAEVWIKMLQRYRNKNSNLTGIDTQIEIPRKRYTEAFKY